MRPPGTTIVIGLLAIIALGGAAYAVLLLALEVSGIGAGMTGGVAGAALAYAAAAVLAAVGLWRRATWGWLAALVVGLAGLLGVLAAALAGAFQAPLLIAILLCGGSVALLLTPDTRRDAGVG